jgi:2-haloalkanoic acid dehalogenase type II
VAAGAVAEGSTADAPSASKAAAIEIVRAPFEASRIRAVAFDAYDTLFDWDFTATIAEYLAESRIECDQEAFASYFRKDAFQAVSLWAPGHRAEDGTLDRHKMLDGPTPEWISTWEMWRRQFEHTFAQHEVQGDAVQGANRLRDVLAAAPAFPEAFEAVERLAARGLLVGLMSNADEDFLQSAVSCNRLRFSVIQSSESLRVYKPHRASFAALCGRLGEATEAVLYVGDSAQTDVLGAAHAGLRTAWVHRNTETKYPEDIVTPDLDVTSLLGVVEALGG